ncbi:hypothetical protein [Piscibacillus halophilus]|nr:hypothetical protein [Piscibacillus halophilus]
MVELLNNSDARHVASISAKPTLLAKPTLKLIKDVYGLALPTELMAHFNIKQ